MPSNTRKTYNRLQERRQYIKNRMQTRGGTIKNEVKRIARDLFLNERTIYRDYYDH